MNPNRDTLNAGYPFTFTASPSNQLNYKFYVGFTQNQHCLLY